jgi:Tol biopolymer transport system component
MSRAPLHLALAVGLLSAAPASTQDPQLVTRVPPGLVSDTAMSLRGAASADGRYVAFVSPGLNLVAGQVDDTGAADIFLRDRTTGQTTLVSHVAGSPLTAAGASGSFSISADGAYVLFESSGTHVAAGQVDANEGADVFVWERATNTTLLVSHRAGQPEVAAGAGFSHGLGLSGDGRYALFLSAAADVVAGQIDGNDDFDLFL